MTLIVKVQRLFATRVPLERDVTLAPGFALTTALEPLVQKPVILGCVATTKPAGKLSVKLTPVNVPPPLLVTVKLRVVLAPIAILAAPNALVIVG